MPVRFPVIVDDVVIFLRFNHGELGVRRMFAYMAADTMDYGHTLRYFKRRQGSAEKPSLSPAELAQIDATAHAIFCEHLFPSEDVPRIIPPEALDSRRLQ